MGFSISSFDLQPETLTDQFSFVLFYSCQMLMSAWIPTIACRHAPIFLEDETVLVQKDLKLIPSIAPLAYVSILHVYCVAFAIKDVDSRLQSSYLYLRCNQYLSHFVAKYILKFTAIVRCNSSEEGCQQVCAEDHGHPMCSCYKVYQLLADNKSCVGRLKGLRRKTRQPVYLCIL